MSDDDSTEVDPRYDPAFQRGFAGEVATGPRGQSTLRRTAAVNPVPQRVGLRDDPRVSPPPAAPSQAEPSVFAPVAEPALFDASVASATPAATSVVAPAGAPAATPRELARNPFTIALAVLAAVLLLSGVIWAYEGFAAIITNGGTRNEVEFWAAQTMSFGAPLAIVTGLAVVAVLLVLFGRSWQRTR